MNHDTYKHRTRNSLRHSSSTTYPILSLLWPLLNTVRAVIQPDTAFVRSCRARRMLPAEILSATSCTPANAARTAPCRTAVAEHAFTTDTLPLPSRAYHFPLHHHRQLYRCYPCPPTPVCLSIWMTSTCAAAAIQYSTGCRSVFCIALHDAPFRWKMQGLAGTPLRLLEQHDDADVFHVVVSSSSSSLS